MVSEPPKVFISYSHDSPEHAQHVLELAERLRKDGVDALLDQYVAGTPAEGWPRWVLDRLDWADFVLLVCTETYYRRFRGHEQPEKSRGVDWELSSRTKSTTPEVLQRSLCQPYFPLMRQTSSHNRF
jgi:SEFIR domain